VETDQAFLAMRKWLAVMRHAWYPAELHFTVSCHDGQLAMGWEITCARTDDAHLVAESMTVAAAATTVWLGLGAATWERPWPALPPASHRFRAIPRREDEMVAVRALPWIAVAERTGTWHLRMTLLGTGAPCEPRFGPRGTRDRDDRAPVDENGSWRDAWEDDRVGDVDGQRALPIELVLHGTGSLAPVLASLVAEDTRGSEQLIPVPADHRDSTDVLWVSPELVAHLLCAPARVPGLLPSHPPSSPQDLFARLDETANGHRLVIGASGQGKTTLLAHLGDRALEGGSSVVAVDTHDGALVRTLAERSRRHGHRPLVVQLRDPSSGGRYPSLDVLKPPPGVSADAWADALWLLFRSVLWADMPTQAIGKVGERAGRAMLRAVVRDPVREATLQDWPRLLDPHDGWRSELLARIDDQDLTRIFAREIMPMVTSRDPDNAAIWLVSLAEPVIGNPATAAILSTPHNAVPLEEALAEGRPVLIHAPGSVLGDAGASLVSAVVMNRASLAARRTPPAAGVCLIADEFHRHPSSLYERDIPEMRKFGADYVLATQSLHQLTSRLRDIVLANVGAVLAFRTSPHDSDQLSELYPSISRKELQTLPRHHVAVTTFESDAVLATPPPLPVPDEVPTWQPDVEDVGAPRRQRGTGQGVRHVTAALGKVDPAGHRSRHPASDRATDGGG
jgi:hypothetical protein